MKAPEWVDTFGRQDGSVPRLSIPSAARGTSLIERLSSGMWDSSAMGDQSQSADLPGIAFHASRRASMLGVWTDPFEASFGSKRLRAVPNRSRIRDEARPRAALTATAGPTTNRP